MHRCLAVRRLVRDDELDRRPETGVAVAVDGLERLEHVSELLGEEVVDGCEHLGPRPVVERQREHLLGGIPTLAEDGHVGVAEAVDRLELVADEEEILRRAAGHEVDELTLEVVRVLELVHQDRAEAHLLALPNDGVVAQQVAHAELEILEVERRLGVLRRLIRLREREQQLLEQRAVARRELLVQPRRRQRGGRR